MKTLKRLFLAAYCMVLLYACTQNEDALGPSIDPDTDLIGAIQSAEMQTISFSELPTSAQSVVTQEHADKYVENAKQANRAELENHSRYNVRFQIVSQVAHGWYPQNLLDGIFHSLVMLPLRVSGDFGPIKKDKLATVFRNNLRNNVFNLAISTLPIND